MLAGSDLDGDGAADVITTSARFELLGGNGYELSEPQLHLHYGTPATILSVR